MNGGLNKPEFVQEIRSYYSKHTDWDKENDVWVYLGGGILISNLSLPDTSQA